MANKDKTKAPVTDAARPAPAAGHTDIQDLEDQLFLFWNRNKGIILGGIALIFLVFIGFQAFRYFQTRAESGVREGYQSAATAEAKARWAQEESGHPLSGFAYKELGDQAFAQGDLSAAEGYYRNAAQYARSVVKQAATIALAATLKEQGKLDEAKSILQPIASDAASPAQGEARYRLAQIEAEQGNSQAARSHIQSIDPMNSFWKAQGEQLLGQLPNSGS